MYFQRIVAEIIADGHSIRYRIAQGAIKPNSPLSKTYLRDGSEVSIWWKDSLPPPEILAAAHKVIGKRVQAWTDDKDKWLDTISFVK